MLGIVGKMKKWIKEILLIFIVENLVIMIFKKCLRVRAQYLEFTAEMSWSCFLAQSAEKIQTKRKERKKRIHETKLATDNFWCLVAV